MLILQLQFKVIVYQLNQFDQFDQSLQRILNILL